MAHAGLWRAFDLSFVGYFLDFVLVPACVILLFLIFPISIGMLLTGFVTWTLAEYLIHRFVFHGNSPFESMHQMHHALPKDWIGIASWGTFLGFLVIGLSAGVSFVTGFMLGYLFYCIIHVWMHHGDSSQFGSYIAYMHRLHNGHHRGGRGNFGVTSPVWDFAFSTYRMK